MGNLNSKTQRITIRIMRPFIFIRLFIALVVAGATVGCVAPGGLIGVRRGLSSNDILADENSGLYGGPAGTSAIYSNDDPGLSDDANVDKPDKPTFVFGVNYNMFFTKKETLHTFLPTLTVQTTPAFTYQQYDIFGFGYGASIGIGPEWGNGARGFHAAICGGAYIVTHLNLCGRISTKNGGWMGMDVKAMLPPPTTLSTTAHGAAYILVFAG